MAAPRNRFVLCLVWLVVASSMSRAASPVTLSVDIGPQPVAEALAAFGRQTGLQLIYLSTIAEEQRSKGARAGLGASAALAQLLDGTGLRFEFLNDRTVRIFPEPAIAPMIPAPVPARQHHAERIAGLDEVVVTATRREEPLSRVPIDMAVWSQEAMEVSGVKGMAQIGTFTPGVDFDFRSNVSGDAYTELAIRGVSGRHGTTVGIYLDDTPIPPGRVVTYARSFPVTFDLERVEVLRGPQGTLLGDHTQGGAVRFITNQPSLTTFSGLARAEWATTANGGTSYEVGAAAGGPIVSDVLGFRVSGWYRADGGYVDWVDPFTLATVDANSNRFVSETVRGALMFAPDESVRITPSLTYQSTRVHNTSTFYTGLSNLEAGELRNGSLVQQPFEDTFYLASLKITAGLRIGELSSVTSNFDRTATATLDSTPAPPVSYTDAVADYVGLKQSTFFEEVRLTSLDPEAALTWIAGTAFSSGHARHPDRTVAPAMPDLIDATVIDQTQLAAFGQISLRVTERLTASAGLRIGHSEYNSATETPPIFHAAAADTWMTPRFVFSYQADEHNLFYMTAAKGYGSAGVYPGGSGAGNEPTPYPPDTLWSYEIGAKNDLLDGRVHVSSSVFHIRWNNGQPDSSYENGETLPIPGAAESNGFGLAVQAFVTERVRVDLGIAYTDARSTQTLTFGGEVLVRKGDTVGGAPWSVTASIERDFILYRGVTGSVRAEDAFHSHNPGPYYSDNPAARLFYTPSLPDPSTNVLNLRADLQWRGFELAAFASNALNSRPALGVSPPDEGYPPNGIPTALTLTPRTLNVSATWRF